MEVTPNNKKTCIKRVLVKEDYILIAIKYVTYTLMYCLVWCY